MTAPVDGALDLLDRQVLDRDGAPVGKVDDVELEVPGDGGPPQVVALLLGPLAWGPRLGGPAGRAIAGVAARLSGRHQPLRIPLERVAEMGVSLRLDVGLADIPRATAVEEWLREHVVERIPGGGHATG